MGRRRVAHALRSLVALLLVCASALPAGPVALARGEPEAADDACASPRLQTVTRPATDKRLLFDDFIAPLVAQAVERRASQAAHDPTYTSRIDQGLNARRLSVAILGYGEEHEQTYEEMGVSPTILTLNLDTWDMVTISLSRDIRTPELEDLTATVPPRDPLTLRAGYRLRGFDGLRPIFEAITGLAIDYQVVMRDVFLRDYLQDVSGPVRIVVPKPFHTNVYRLAGQEHPPDSLAAGLQTLDPDHAMTFVLGEELDPQGKVDERSYRKNLLLQTLSCGVRERIAAQDAGFVFNLVRFGLGEINDHNLSTDFDFQMVASGLGQMGQSFVLSRGDVDTTFPQASGARQLVVHDESYGDGGVRRVHNMQTQPDTHGVPDSATVKEELRMGALGGFVLIPIGGDPYADDLVNGYWFAVRQLVRTTLLGTT
jgi:hypothetical protein